MSPDLRDEIRQTRPFASLQQEAFLNVGRTFATLDAGLERVLRPHGVTGAQYNVLRILRGAGVEGLCRNEIRDRLLSRMPDVTRLLDRMEEAGLVARCRSTTDRRLVTTTLTPRGREVVDGLDEPVAAEHARQFAHLSDEQLRALSQLLTLARQPG